MELELTRERFLNKATALIGCAGTGKTVITKKIIALFRETNPILAFTPRDDFVDLVNPAMVHRVLTADLLKFAITFQKHKQSQGRLQNLLIIISDCASQYKDPEVLTQLREIVYMGKHIGITLIIDAQTDKSFDPELKKGFNNTILMDMHTAYNYFHRASNDFDREFEERADRAINEAFHNIGSMVKILYSRNDQELYRYVLTH